MNPGRRFEHQILESLPDWPGIWGWKIATSLYIPPKGGKKDSGESSGQRFTSRRPFDLQIMWMGTELRVVALECKSTGVPRLSFSAVKPHQVEGLQKAAAAGAVAGVLWEPRRLKDAPAYFIPIDFWVYLSLSAKSANVHALGSLVDLGFSRGGKCRRLRVQGGRGRTHRYFQMAAFLLEITS